MCLASQILGVPSALIGSLGPAGSDAAAAAAALVDASAAFALYFPGTVSAPSSMPGPAVKSPLCVEMSSAERDGTSIQLNKFEKLSWKPLIRDSGL